MYRDQLDGCDQQSDVPRAECRKCFWEGVFSGVKCCGRSE